MAPDYEDYLDSLVKQGGSMGLAASETLEALVLAAEIAKAQVTIDVPAGHTAADVERHDEGHDNWHAMHGDPPCKDEADCARMRASYKDDDGTEVQKRDVSEAERERLADKGNAMPDGSYPIANVSDLKNAIQAYGRAKDKEAVKAHIKSRAKELGAEDLLPENW